MADLRAMWQELWWAMSGGKKSEYDRIKATPVFEFWKLFDLWKAHTSREREIAQARARKKQ